HYSLFVTSADPICGTTDDAWNGCVHFNSGIMNKAFYLAAEGGEHHDIKVAGIGGRKLGRIVHHAPTTKLNPSTGLQDGAHAFRSSCLELAENSIDEIGRADCSELLNAFRATGLLNSNGEPVPR